MKKLFLILAILSLVGVAHAGIVVDPGNGPMIEVVPVYNNDTITLSTGSVAIWDFASSTGDNDNYVKSSTSANTFLVAGVVYPYDIAAGDTGSIAIYGVVDCDVLSGVGAGDNLCTSTTAGKADNCTTAAGTVAQFGWAINANTSTEKCFVNAK